MKKSHIEDILALTPMQHGMLFHYLKDPESDAYFEQLSLSLSGKIDIKRFEKSWNFVIETNEMLRSRFRWEKIEHPIRIILKEFKLQPRYYDFSGNDTCEREQLFSESEKKIRLEEIKAEDRQEKFDLREVPFRVILCKVEEAKYVMIISNHHILYDGWSNGIILKEFFIAYNNLSRGKDLVGPVKTKFIEFIKWNQNRDPEKQKKFWRNYLKGVDTQIEVSIKQKRKRKDTTKTSTEQFQIRFAGDMKDKIEDFIKKHKITLPSLLYSAWGVLLQRYNNSDDVVFGTTVSGRSAKVQGIHDIVGLFINTLPLRIQIQSNEKIGDLLHRIDSSLQMREEYEAASLVSIKEYSEIDGKEELFDTMINITNYPLDSRLMMENTDSSLRFDSYSIVEMTHYDLTVSVMISGDIKIDFYYKRDCFNDQAIENMANHFTGIVYEFLKNPGKEIPGIEILSPKERIRLLEFNNTGTHYPVAKTLHELFEEESETHPGHTAVVFEDEQVTYGELNKRANGMAEILRAKGVKNDSIVGLMLDRSINMMIGILGILKAGGRFLGKTAPLGPVKHPQKLLINRSHMSHRSYIYQTGDLARWLTDGNIEFLGRIDHQVKIRGFRIELGEIENRLLSHKEIKEAVVTVKESEKTGECLYAFIVAGKKFTAVELRTYLAKELPDYMIPSYFVQLEEMPLSINGKVNRKALPFSGSALGTGEDYVSPENDIEKAIAGIWKELLGLDTVGIHDNFFDIGGNSFTMIRLNSRLREAFQEDISMTDLFNYPTVASLARHLMREKREKPGRTDFPGKEMKQVEGTSGGLVQIAVIGMAGRFPSAGNIDEFWTNIKNGVEAITCLSAEDFRQMGVNEDLLDNPAFVRSKGRLQDIDYFDSFFFGYTPREAAKMDPQIRIFHECCWEALENAGYAPGAYDGDIGLFAGATPNPFWEIMSLKQDTGISTNVGSWHPDVAHREAVQFSDKDYLSARISYKLNLTGPVMTMQTGCSTSLTAVTQACQGLIVGVCDLALAGGVSVTLHDRPGYIYREGAVMSPQGHCRSFDARADGTVGGNGAGVVVLKRLTGAILDRVTIYAVIKGFGINNDGKNKAGFTAPSSAGQARVIEKAHRMAGTEPGSIAYVETHGTGTILGDPIEIEALKQAFKSKSPESNKRNACAIGSVKSNIGHLDAAAGIAGFIKAILMLTHRLIPPQLHFETLNPGIDFENSPFYVNTGLKEWKSEAYPLRAGVSSFGIGGTNVHVVLQEAPAFRGQKTEDRRQKGRNTN